jgi:hypothetical protein
MEADVFRPHSPLRSGQLRRTITTGEPWSGARLGSVATEAAEQRDAADEGRLEASGSIIVGKVIVNQGKVVRPSQLIASVRRTAE